MEKMEAVHGSWECEMAQSLWKKFACPQKVKQTHHEIQCSAHRCEPGDRERGLRS